MRKSQAVGNTTTVIVEVVLFSIGPVDLAGTALLLRARSDCGQAATENLIQHGMKTCLALTLVLVQPCMPRSAAWNVHDCMPSALHESIHPAQSGIDRACDTCIRRGILQTCRDPPPPELPATACWRHRARHPIRHQFPWKHLICIDVAAETAHSGRSLSAPFSIELLVTEARLSRGPVRSFMFCCDLRRITLL